MLQNKLHIKFKARDLFFDNPVMEPSLLQLERWYANFIFLL